MSIVLPTHGQSLWDTPLDTAITQIASGGMHTNDHGWKAWTCDPQFCGANDQMVSGTVRMIKLPVLPQPYTITSVKYFVALVAVAPVAGQCFSGIYDAAGNLLAVTADISAGLTTTGMKTHTLTVPLVVPASTAVWVAHVFNAGTMPTGVSAATVTGRETLYNGDLSIAAARYTSGPAAQTTLPLSITMGARTLLARSAWAAVA